MPTGEGRLTSAIRRAAPGLSRMQRRMAERTFAEIEEALAEDGAFRALQIKHKLPLR